MYQKIQKFKRQGYSSKRVAHKLRINPRTAAKYFKMDEEEFRAYRREHLFRDRAFSGYESDILEVYAENNYRKLNMSSVYDYLEEKHGILPGSEQTLRNFIGYLTETERLRVDENKRTYTKVPELPFGEQMQLDFGQYACRSGVKLYIFAGVLSASRYKYVRFQGRPFKTKDVIDHLLRCFEYFGGVPKEMVIDQDSLMVVSENAGDIIYTDDFKYFIQEQEMKMYVCRKSDPDRKSDPETKGKIESVIKYVKYNFLSIRDFKSVDEANKSVFKWLRRRANGKISQATKQIPLLMIEYEREALRPLRNSIFRKESLLGREERLVNEKDCISVDACQYQLPSRYREKKVEIYMTRHKLFVFDLYTGEEIVAYDVSLIPGKKISKEEFRREPERKVKELKEQVTDMFDLEKWKQFTERNFKRFSRYVRDQCIEAKKHFGRKDIDRDILDEALRYCLENETLSFANLKDTYFYFKREEKASKEVFEKPPGIDRNFNLEPLDIHQRDLSVYKELIGKKESSHESI